jgi:hypothetical protein
MRKILANGQNCIDPIDQRHLQVHKSYVWLMGAKLLDRLASITGLCDHDHIRFGFEDGGDPFPNQRMVVGGKNSNWVVGGHN